MGTAILGAGGMSENDVVFENKEHDFPQRIIYRLVASGKLLGLSREMLMARSGPPIFR
jgi:hypothetical protein